MVAVYDQHKLVDSCVKADRSGVTARCSCGWVSGGHFSGAAASAAFMDHQEECGRPPHSQETVK
jgi:hypothetical protein